MAVFSKWVFLVDIRVTRGIWRLAERLKEADGILSLSFLATTPMGLYRGDGLPRDIICGVPSEGYKAVGKMKTHV